ncbi:hypothetical protein [Acidithiobacillus ferriphilus]|uniref:hypothetical protein n=1 Tax=Acidithiobacillus ferriphilus TaxID=1689834 RepID=UPI001C0685DE|nr:hypothetical protein [Acidithiobacillus ferriphilus]MBU2828795.1 hypothetical protein [Acidithiobacillus ferriphilus]MBU2845971.1 hypothetical protein [Acidithiobacillus ferriphilus]MEB8475082.1 hypothetical protein [Acidithiobacillus ferriphilus]UEP59942.1 hypothetical protein K1Y48_04680 [Acidithiobacillus ferriphilus]
MISKRGKPPVKTVPIADETLNSMFGYMKGTVTIHGNIVAPSGEVWSAESGDEDYFYAGLRPRENKSS